MGQQLLTRLLTLCTTLKVYEIRCPCNVIPYFSRGRNVLRTSGHEDARPYVCHQVRDSDTWESTTLDLSRARFRSTMTLQMVQKILEPLLMLPW